MEDLRPFAPIIVSRRTQRTYRRRKITIQNNLASALTALNPEILFTNLETHAATVRLLQQSGVRLTGPSGQIPHYPKFWPGNGAGFDLKMDLGASETVDVYMHYDGYVQNPWDPAAVFKFFDDFPGSALDDTKWDATIAIGGSGTPTFTVENSILKVTTASGHALFRPITTTYVATTDADYRIDAAVKIHAKSGAADFGLIARYVDTNNFWMAAHSGWENESTFDLAVRKTGSYTDKHQLGTLTALGAFHDIGLQILGSAGNAKARVDGQELWSASDNFSTQGRAGILADDEFGGTGTYWFDHVRVAKLCSTLPTITIGAEELVTRRW